MKNAWKAVAAIAVLIAVSVFGCAYDPASIEVTPAQTVVNSPDQAPALVARVLDRSGQAISDAEVDWSSSAPGVATIESSSGELTVKESGKAVITAAVGAVKGTAVVTVAIYHGLKVGAEAVTLRVGEGKRIAAAIVDENGKPVVGEIAWASADPKIATISPKGEITAIAAGATIVTATAKALKAEVKVEVQAVGPAQLRAAKEAVTLKVGKTEKVEVRALDAKAEPAEGFIVTFASADAAVATVNEDGAITAVAAGETAVTATSGDKTVSIKVTVK
jgi:uncharacterized protein YjdB